MGKVFTLDGINQDLLRGSRGDDIVQGSPDRPSIRNGRSGEIRLLKGNDIIRSEQDIVIYGTISLGSGRDVITGVRSVSLLYDWKEGLDTGFVRTGRGADRIEVSGGPLVVGEDAHLEMGGGNDEILARDLLMGPGFLRAGAGDDRIDVGDGKIIAPFYARLELGDGDDTLIARGGLEATSEGTTLSMGAGNDLVDFSQGGIDTFGGKTGIETALNLGSGDDRIIGFPQVPEPWQLDSLWTSPAGVVRGGKGRDTFVLPEGVYEISADRISTDETFLPVAGFNVLEGINGGRFSYAPGVLTVDENGIAAFAPDL